MDKPTMKSVHSIFADRGDDASRDRVTAPYVPHVLTDVEAKLEEARKKAGMPSLFYAAERREKFKSTPDPDFDMYFADKAKDHPEPGSEKTKTTRRNGEFRTLSILMNMHNKMRGKS